MKYGDKIQNHKAVFFCSNLTVEVQDYKGKVAFLCGLEKRWKRSEPKVTRIKLDSFVLSVAIKADDRILIGTNSGHLTEWEYCASSAATVPARLLQEKKVHSKAVKCMTLWMNEYVVTGSYDHTVKVHRIATLDTVQTLLHHTDSVWDVRAEEGRPMGLVASCGMDGRIALIRKSGPAEEQFSVIFLIQGQTVLMWGRRCGIGIPGTCDVISIDFQT